MTAGRTTDIPEARIRWDRWFVVIGLAFGVGYLLVIPPFQTPDEGSHFLRVSTMANGWFIPPRTTSSVAEYRVDGCTVSKLLQRSDQPQTGWTERFENPPCTTSVEARSALPFIRRAEVYTAVPYAPAIVGFTIGRSVAGASGSLYGARFAQLAAYVGLIWLAIRVSPAGKSLLFATALLPVTLQGAVGISADPITIAIALLCIAMTLRLTMVQRVSGAPATTRDLTELGLVFIALGLAKSAYLPLTAILFAVPTVAFGSLRRRLIWLGGITALVAATSAAWIVGVVGHLQVSINPGFDSEAAGRWVTHHPFDFLSWVWRTCTDSNQISLIARGTIVPIYQVVKRPGAPLWLAVLTLIGLLAIRFLDPPIGALLAPNAANEELSEPPSSRRVDGFLSLLCVLAAVVGAVALVCYGLVITGVDRRSPIITGFQGRYLIPLIPLVLFVGNRIRRRASPGFAMAWVPLASSALLGWWLVVSMRFYNHWL